MDLSHGYGVSFGRVPARSLVGTLGILVLLAALGSGMTGCAGVRESWQAPEVELLAIRPVELGLKRQVFVLTLAVTNPNDRTLPITGLTYRLELAGREAAHGNSALERQIPAHGEREAELQVIGDLLPVIERLPLLLRSERPIAWRLSGRVALAGGPLSLPFSRSGQLDPAVLLRGAPARRRP